MSYEFNEMNKRARQRDMAQQHRQRMRRQQTVLRWTAGILLAAVCILMLFIGLSRREPNTGANASTQSGPQTTQSAATSSTTPPSETTLPAEPETVISLVFGGDLNVTDKVVAAGEHNGQYDFAPLFMDVAALFSGAHAAFLNLEGGFYGPAFGSDTCSAPPALANALAAAGVDMVQLANSKSITSGLTGLSATIDTVRGAGMRPLGVFASTSEREEHQGFTLVNIGGIRVALVAFTKGLDGVSLPEGGEGCVNLLYTDYATTYQKVDETGIRTVLEAAQAQKPDVTIAMVHWGSEYNDSVSPSQEAIVKLMQGLGVDAIVGTHSHFVQKIDYNAEAGTVVAYSLGDFMGNGEKSGTNYSILLNLEITRDNRTGETKITACDYTGIYLLTPEKDNMPLQVVRILPAMAMYENNHVFRVTEEAYKNMVYAWERIQDRVKMS